MSVRSGLFFLVVGPSGVGKDTLLDGARVILGTSGRYVFARRVITRPADAGGEQHEAASEGDFTAREQAGDFLITWGAHGLRYGLPIGLLDALRSGRHVIANGSRATIGEIAKRVPRLVVVSIRADRTLLEKRIAARGRESGDAVAARLNRRIGDALPEDVEVLHVENDGTIEEGVQKLVSTLEATTRRLYLKAYPVDTWRHHIAYLPGDSVIGAADYLGPERVDVLAPDRSIRANVHVVPAGGSLAADEIGLSRQAFEDLALPEGVPIQIRRTPAPDSRAALRAKIQGEALSQAQYAMLLSDIVEGRYADSEVAAFLVAATRSLTDDEVLALARVRASFTERMAWGEPIVADKHSMGGIPGSRITLIVIPIVAAHGLAIPKTSSRAITSAAGTADAMETVAKVDLDFAGLRRVVEQARGCIAWNGRLNHSALDDVMNTITRPLGIDSNRWSVASILSKKLSAGATHVIVDLPFGPQAKLTTQGEAQALAHLFERVGMGLGLTVEAHATDGATPIGRGIGPALEVRDCLMVLDGDPQAPRDLAAKALFFASRILAWDPAVGTVEAGLARARSLLASGAARAAFERIVDAQGRRPDPIRPGPLTQPIRAPRGGRITAMNIYQIAGVARRAGAPLDKGAGIDLLRLQGDGVAAGETLYVIYSGAPADLEAAAKLAQDDSGIVIG